MRVPVYATLADMRADITEADLIDLTDDDHTGSVVEARIMTALEKADAEIDGFVGRHYRRVDASAPVPPLLKAIAVDIAHYRLFRFSLPTERVEKLYEQAVSKLDKIAKGTITLDQGEEKLPEREGQILVESAERTFTRDSMKGF